MHVPLNGQVLSASLADFTSCLNVNMTSAYVAASIATKLDPTVTFFFTGNATNTMHLPGFTISAIGKTGAAYFIEDAAAAKTSAKWVGVHDECSRQVLLLRPAKQGRVAGVQ